MFAEPAHSGRTNQSRWNEMRSSEHDGGQKEIEREEKKRNNALRVKVDENNGFYGTILFSCFGCWLRLLFALQLQFKQH